MKKVLSLVTIMVMLLLVLTGCVDVNYEVTLNKDGTADVTYVYGFDKETLKQMETTADDMTNDMRQNAEASEYEIESYSDDNVEGFKAKKHVEDLAKISLEEAFGSEYVTDSEENQLKVEKKGLKTVYSQNAKIDLTSMDSSMISLVTMKYTVKLPAKAGKNNASEVSKDGKTLTWNLKAGEVNEISFEASSNALVTVAIIIVVALIIIGATVAVIIALKKPRKEKDKAEKTETVKEEKETAPTENKNTNSSLTQEEEMSLEKAKTLFTVTKEQWLTTLLNSNGNIDAAETSLKDELKTKYDAIKKETEFI